MPAAAARPTKRTTTRKRATTPRAPKPAADGPPPADLADADAQVAAAIGEPAPTPEPEPLDKAPDKAPGRSRSGRRSTVKLDARLTEAVATLGIGVCLVNMADGQDIIGAAENIGTALARWADESPKVRRVLEGALTGSAVFGVAAAVAPVAISIAARHGLFSPRPSPVRAAPGATIPADGHDDAAFGGFVAHGPAADGADFGIPEDSPSYLP